VRRVLACSPSNHSVWLSLVVVVESRHARVSKQSARACCPTSVLSVTPSQTHSRDPKLPGTPLRSRDRRPRGARCCGHTNSREGVLRSHHARGWSTRSCVLVLCSMVPWQAPECPGTVPLRAEDCHCPTPNGNMPTICDLGHPMTSNWYHRDHTAQELQ